MPAVEPLIIKPQYGPQEKALACPADILVFGGGAGGGKTWGLLLEPVRHKDNGEFGATIFRRTYPEITKQGAMWDESWKLYPHLDAKPNAADLSWTFPGGAVVQFSHLQHEKDKFTWLGAQIALLGFDQLETFLESQFWYLWSRNRSTCGVQPYTRATVNPIPDDDPVGGWVHKLIQWWLDPATGFAIPERDGVLRWFVRVNEQLVWGESKAELTRRYPEERPVSLTFIEAKLEDNKILERADPTYRAKLRALPRIERERLLNRNWNIKATAGTVFDRSWFKIVKAAPSTGITWVRYWDKAGTEGGGKKTAGVLMGRHFRTETIYVADCTTGHWSFHRREAVIKQKAHDDGHAVKIRLEQEPGSSGKDVAGLSVKMLAGYDVKAAPASGDKFERAGPFGAQAEAGNVCLIEGPWNDEYLAALHAAEPKAKFLDVMDASSGAYNDLAKISQSDWMPEGVGDHEDSYAAVGEVQDIPEEHEEDRLPGKRASQPVKGVVTF